MKTYKNFKEDFEKAKANMELLENIVSVGIPKKQKDFIKPNIDLKNSQFNKSKGIGCVYIEKQFV